MPLTRAQKKREEADLTKALERSALETSLQPAQVRPVLLDLQVSSEEIFSSTDERILQGLNLAYSEQGGTEKDDEEAGKDSSTNPQGHLTKEVTDRDAVPSPKRKTNRSKSIRTPKISAARKLSKTASAGYALQQNDKQPSSGTTTRVLPHRAARDKVRHNISYQLR